MFSYSIVPYPLSAGQAPGDDHALDLVGALEDGPELGIPHQFLYRILPAVTIATQDLHGIFVFPQPPRGELGSPRVSAGKRYKK